jgi:hypothetical protein
MTRKTPQQVTKKFSADGVRLRAVSSFERRVDVKVVAGDFIDCADPELAIDLLIEGKAEPCRLADIDRVLAWAKGNPEQLNRLLEWLVNRPADG